MHLSQLKGEVRFDCRSESNGEGASQPFKAVKLKRDSVGVALTLRWSTTKCNCPDDKEEKKRVCVWGGGTQVGFYPEEGSCTGGIYGILNFVTEIVLSCLLMFTDEFDKNEYVIVTIEKGQGTRKYM